MNKKHINLSKIFKEKLKIIQSTLQNKKKQHEHIEPTVQVNYFPQKNTKKKEKVKQKTKL